jgi:hypothetical protein
MFRWNCFRWSQPLIWPSSVRLVYLKFGLQVLGLGCRAVFGDLNPSRAAPCRSEGYCRECAGVVIRVE